MSIFKHLVEAFQLWWDPSIPVRKQLEEQFIVNDQLGILLQSAPMADFPADRSFAATLKLQLGFAYIHPKTARKVLQLPLPEFEFEAPTFFQFILGATTYIVTPLMPQDTVIASRNRLPFFDLEDNLQLGRS